MSGVFQAKKWYILFILWWVLSKNWRNPEENHQSSTITGGQLPLTFNRLETASPNVEPPGPLKCIDFLSNLGARVGLRGFVLSRNFWRRLHQLVMLVTSPIEEKRLRVATCNLDVLDRWNIFENACLSKSLFDLPLNSCTSISVISHEELWHSAHGIVLILAITSLGLYITCEQRLIFINHSIVWPLLAVVQRTLSQFMSVLNHLTNCLCRRC